MSASSFDAIIVGSGTSAYFCATALNQAGQRVAVVDERPFGGTCALRGCQPKKYLVANAEAVAMAAHLTGRGLSHRPKTNWAELQKLKNEFLDGIPEGEVKESEEAGIATIAGRARMTGRDEIEAAGRRMRGKHIVLATGAVPRRSNFPGSERVVDSETFLNLPELPERIVFIGGGYISFEFAHVTAWAGGRATVLHRSARPLKAFDKDMVDIILEASQDSGVSVALNESPTRVASLGDHLEVHGATGARYPADLVVEASGRTPNLSALEGDAGGVDHTARGVTVNAYMQSVSNPNVYAIGDCADSSSMLAPLADEEGKVAARNILTGNTVKMDATAAPSAVFTIPNLAAVGLTEEQARRSGLDVRINRGSTANWPSSKRIGEQRSGYKVIINQSDDTIVGAHLARHNAAEVINIFALAIKKGVTAGELSEFLWCYPTYVSDLKYMVK